MRITSFRQEIPKYEAKNENRYSRKDYKYMTREQYEALSVAALKEIAKNRGMRHISALKKREVIERMLS